MKKKVKNEIYLYKIVHKIQLNVYGKTDLSPRKLADQIMENHLENFSLATVCGGGFSYGSKRNQYAGYDTDVVGKTIIKRIRRKRK